MASMPGGAPGRPDGGVRPALRNGVAQPPVRRDRPGGPRPPRLGTAAVEAAATIATLEARLDAYRAERAALAGALGAMSTAETPEATATAIATALLRLHGFAGVGVFAFTA